MNGRQNITTLDLCMWINKSLLPNSTMESGYPRKVSVETARKWLHELGFEILTAKKGIFIDDHERDDVIACRNEFICKIIKIGLMHLTNEPTDEALNNFPKENYSPIEERKSKNVVFFP